MTAIRGKHLAGASTGALATTLIAAYAWAAPVESGMATSGLEEIVVTAERRATSLQDTPISITALTGEALAQYGVQDVFDLQLVTPGLLVGHNFQGQIYIRGIGTDLQGVGVDASVAVHVDGVYIPRPNVAVQNYFDVERIEVLRGPQGTLYGRNATGGVINVISKQPTAEYSGDAEILYGNYDKIRFKGAVGGPLINDKVLARFAFIGSQRDGYTKNLYTGKRLSDEDFVSGRMMFKFLPSENFDILLTGDLTRDRSKTITVKLIDPQNSLAVLLGGRTSPDPFEVYHDIEGPMQRDQSGISGKMTWRLPGVTITSLTAYRKSDTSRAADSDGTDFGIIGEQGSNEHSQSFTEELQFASASDGPFQWVGGIYYFHEKAHAEYMIPFPLIDSFITLPGRNKTSALAGFAQLSYNVTDALRVTAGLRYSYEKKNATNSSTFNGATVFVRSGEDSWKAWTPKFGIDYHITEDTMVYATITRGFKSGGFNMTGDQESFDPEFIWSYEAGLKSQFLDNRVQTNLSAFYYNYQDLQVNVILDASTVVDNAGKARIYGAEFELSAQPIAGLEIIGSVALLNTKIQELFSYDPNIPDSPLLDLSGNRLGSSPKFTSNLAVQYTWPLQNYGNLTLRGEMQHQSHAFFSQFNAPFEEQDAFSIYNARLTFITTDGRWKLSFYGRNLSNKAYLVAGARVNIVGGSVAGYYAAPRTYGASVGYSF